MDERDRFLSIYMNDHLAAGIAWREVARRAQRQNDGTELGEALASIAKGIAEDVETFEEVMDLLDVPRDRIKAKAGLVAERLGRLKLNGRLRGYSPLSRFVELDFLAMGIEGKKVLWANLADIAGLRERFPSVDFDGLIARAEAQRAQLEPLRERAGREALAPPKISSS